MFRPQGSPPVKGSSGQKADVEALAQAHITIIRLAGGTDILQRPCNAMQGPVAKYMSGSQGSPPVKGSSGQRADVEALGQAHINAVAGACLSIGIKFAGSANAAAEQVLRHYVLYFLKAKLQDSDSSQGTAC